MLPSRGRGRGRGRYSSQSASARARERYPIVEAFRFLADSCFDKGGEIGNTEWKPQEYVFPFSDDHSEVTLSDYYGDVHCNLLNKTPKSLSYKPCNTEEAVIKMKIEALLKGMCSKTKESTDSRPSCRLEVDFIKMLLISPRDFGSGSLKIADLQRKLCVREENPDDKLRMSLVRAFLSDGPDGLIGILENLGAKFKKKEKKDDTLRCVCFKTNFKYRNRSFESSLFVNPGDLAFHSWHSIIYPEGAMCLANPRLETDVSDDDTICDLRIKAKTKAMNEVGDLRELWKNRGLSPPPTLTQPGLNHLFRHNSTNDGFVVERDAHIFAILEKTNKIDYFFDMEGFEVILGTSDGREFDVDESGRNELKYSYECWPNLLFIIEDEERIPQLVDLVYRCVITLFDALAERQLEVRPWRCFVGPRGDSQENIPSSKAQVLRRIFANDTLDEMLGVPGEKNRHILSNCLHEVLKEIENVNAISNELDPIELRKKLIRAAVEMGIKTE